MGCILDSTSDFSRLHTLVEYVYEPSSNSITELRTTKIDALNFQFDSFYNFNVTGFTPGAEISLIQPGFMNYGLKESNLDEPLTFELFEFDYTHFDYSPTLNRVIFNSTKSEYFFSSSGDSIYADNESLIYFNTKTSEFDSVYIQVPQFVDSLSIELKSISESYFAPDNQPVAFVTDQVIKLATNSNNQTFQESSYGTSYLIKFGTNNSRDTLFTYEPTQNYDRPELIANQFGIFIELQNYKEFNNGVYKVSTQGELNFVSNTSIPGQFSIDGSTYVTKYQNESYNFDSNTSYFLRSTFTNNRSSFPNSENIVLIDALNDDVLYLYSLENDEITDSVTAGDLPNFNETNSGENLISFRFANPILTQDNRILFMTILTTNSNADNTCRQ